MTWTPIHSPADYYKLSGETCPGISKVRGNVGPFEWDEQKGLGLSGSHLRPVGIGLARFSIETRLYTKEEYEQYEAFYNKFLTPPPAWGSRSSTRHLASNFSIQRNQGCSGGCQHSSRGGGRTRRLAHDHHLHRMESAEKDRHETS